MHKTELHLHTKEVSPCCDCPTEITVERYLAAGYTTVVVTDHFNPDLVSRAGSPEAAAEHLFDGYREFCRLAAGRLHVLSGFELRLEENRNEYLVYGLGHEFLLQNPDLVTLTRREALNRVHGAGGLMFIAHPFRDRMTVINPGGFDGVEIFNAHNGHDSRNELAYAYARHHGLAGIAGTDYHHTTNAPSAGIMTNEPITNEKELLAILRSGGYRTFGEIAPKSEE